MGKFYLYDGNEWVDICKCSMSDGNQYSAFKNNSKYIYDGDEWLNIKCTEQEYFRNRFPVLHANQQDIIVSDMRANEHVLLQDELNEQGKKYNRVLVKPEDITNVDANQLRSLLGNGFYSNTTNKYYFSATPVETSGELRIPEAKGLYIFDTDFNLVNFLPPDNLLDFNRESTFSSQQRRDDSSIDSVSKVGNDKILLYQAKRQRLLIEDIVNIENNDEVKMSNGFNLNIRISTTNGPNRDLFLLINEGGGSGLWTYLEELDLMVFVRRNMRVPRNQAGSMLVFDFSKWTDQKGFSDSYLGYYVFDEVQRTISLGTTTNGTDIYVSNARTEELIRYDLSGLGFRGSNIIYGEEDSISNIIEDTKIDINQFDSEFYTSILESGLTEYNPSNNKMYLSNIATNKVIFVDLPSTN